MKIGIFGANGQLGTDIIKTKPQKFETIPLTREDADITKYDSLKRIFQRHNFQYLINTAAYHQTDGCEKNPILAFETNTIAVKHMVELCQEFNVKLVQISTDYVFGGNYSRNTPYFEDDEKSPINIYGLSKSASEDIIQYSLDNYMICRISSLYGKTGSRGKGNNFVYTIRKLGLEKDKLEIINDITMSPTYTIDAANGIWKLIEKENEKGIYHLSNSGECTWYEFARSILEFSKIEVDIEPISHKNYHSLARKPVYSSLTDNKNLKIKHWKEGLKEFIFGLDSKINN